MKKPRMFIGSSVEGKDIAEHIQLGLEYDVETTIWHQGIFGLSGGSLELLVKAAKDFDFAALVLTPDDLVMKRGTEKGCPRDNVVFELGLFMGALGRKRTFIIYNRDKTLDLPTDLAGVTPATFANRSDDNLEAALGPVCTKLKKAIKACAKEMPSPQHTKKDSAASSSSDSDTSVDTGSGKRSIVQGGKAIVMSAGYCSPPTLVVDQGRQGNYATITEALKAAEPGTRILVRPGLYKENIVIDKHVEILGYGERDEIVIESFSRAAIVFVANRGRIAKLTIRQVGSDDWYGVDISQGELELEDCDISSQGKACVAILHSAYPYLRRNRIHDGSCVGIFVCKMGQGSIEDNDIFNNQSAGVAITAGGKSTLRRNRISQNGNVGISVHSGGSGTFEDNDLRGNAKGAWFIDPRCEANVQRRGNKE